MTLGQSRRRTRRSSAFPHGNSSTKGPTVAPNWDETAWMDAEIPSSLRMPWSTWTHSSDLMPQLRSDGGRAYIAAAWTWRTRAPTVAPILGRTAWMDVEIPSSLRMPVNLDPQLRSDGGRAYTSAAWTWRTGAPAVAPILGRNSLDGCGDTFLSTYALVNLDPQLRSDGGRAYTSAAWTWPHKSAYSGSTIGTKQLGWMWRYLPLYVCPGQLGPTAQMAGVLIRLYPGRQVQTDLPFRMGTVAQWRLW